MFNNFIFIIISLDRLLFIPVVLLKKKMSEEGDEHSLLIGKSDEIEGEDGIVDDYEGVEGFPRSVKFIIGNEFCER